MHAAQRFLYTLGLLLALLFAAPPLSFSAEESGALLKGQLAYNSGQYGEALAQWESAAQGGSAEAQLLLGIMHSNGIGTPANDALAAQWYQQAAQAGNRDAQLLLGLMYLNSRQIQDPQQAWEWIARAATNGDKMAQEFMRKANEKGWITGGKLAAGPTTTPVATKASASLDLP